MNSCLVYSTALVENDWPYGLDQHGDDATNTRDLVWNESERAAWYKGLKNFITHKEALISGPNKTASNCAFWFWGSWHDMSRNLTFFEKNGCAGGNVIHWIKPNAVDGHGHRWLSSVDHATVGYYPNSGGSAWRFGTHGYARQNWISADRMKDSDVRGRFSAAGERETSYPQAKPMSVAAMPVIHHTCENDTIVNMCAGTGNLMKAAIITGRSVIVFERDPSVVKMLRHLAQQSFDLQNSVLEGKLTPIVALGLEDVPRYYFLRTQAEQEAALDAASVDMADEKKDAAAEEGDAAAPEDHSEGAEPEVEKVYCTPCTARVPKAEVFQCLAVNCPNWICWPNLTAFKKDWDSAWVPVCSVGRQSAEVDVAKMYKCKEGVSLYYANAKGAEAAKPAPAVGPAA